MKKAAPWVTGKRPKERTETMSTLRHLAEKRKIVTTEQLVFWTPCPVSTLYLKYLLKKDKLDDTLRAAVQAELERRGEKR